MRLANPSRFSFVTNEIIALSRTARPDRGSWRSVKQGILNAATYLREEAGQISPPIALDSIKKLRCIKKEVAFEYEGPLDAILAPVSGGFILRLRKDQISVRRRFSIAHEIGHTFFYNLDYDPPIRVLSGGRFQQEEDICNVFAGELLMPSELVQQDIANLGALNLQAVIDLAKRYRVSPEVAARKLLLDMSEFQSSILLFKDSNAQGKKNVWWYYGKAVRRYLRKQERIVFEQVVQAIQEDLGQPNLEHIVASNPMVSIEHYQPRPNSRLMSFLTFKR